MSGFQISGDLALSADETDLVLVSGIERVIQEIRVKLQVFRGTFRFDLDLGMPYFEDVLVKGPDMTVIKQTFAEAIGAVVGVQSVTAIDLTLMSDRTLQVKYKARTTFGRDIADQIDFTVIGIR